MAVVERPVVPRNCSAGPVSWTFSHGVTMIVRIGLPSGTVNCSCAVIGAAACDELELTLRDGPTGGTAVPGVVTNAADGTWLAGVAPAIAPVHFGIRTMRRPSPWGSSSVIAPGAFLVAVGFDEITLAPVPHGDTTTVRAASALGTITARIPAVTALTLLLLLPTADPITRITINATITTQTTRFPSERCWRCRFSGASLVLVCSAIASSPRSGSGSCRRSQGPPSCCCCC
jgi:hypothetical protein